MSDALMQMPRYKSHKQVWALQIGEGLKVNPDGSVVLPIVDSGYEPVTVERGVVQRYMPMPGDFYVVYEDGYKSISPRKAFLEGYELQDGKRAHEGLPVKGYKPQGSYPIHEVNCNKELEEQVLRQIDMLQKDQHLAVDQRWLAIGRTAIEQGFMAINRAVFKPGRVKLPGEPD
jgi:hypothetical protein